MGRANLSWRWWALAPLAALALAGPAAGAPANAGSVPLDAGRCAALAGEALPDAPAPGLAITSARWHEAGLVVEQRGGKSAPLPAHCEIEGSYGAYVGRIGGPYATGFRMRLPQDWNRRYFFQGGGGSNGVVGDATGSNGPGNPTALERGYAVIAQDSGHDNARNRLADHAGELVFGFDPQARTNYGHASLKPTYDLGRSLIRQAYGTDPKVKLFWGCSKGGQEGMAFAQRYPDAFDGIVAMAPGFALPRAAVAEAWDTQQLAGILKARGVSSTIASLKAAFTPDQLKLVSEAALTVCDALDGATDGMILAVGRCTSARVLPKLREHTCKPGNSGTCLAPEQIAALDRIMSGPHDGRGKALYAPWPWDAGMGEPGWRVWKAGLEGGPPALNVVLGASSLASVFTTPPTPLPGDPEQLLAWQLAFDFDRDAAKIYAVAPPYATSPWQDVGMRSADLSAFRRHGGKLIVPHGMSDPVFSAYDTLGWWDDLDRRENGRAAAFVRVFPVPGMNHCGGGPATGRFDSLSALEHWVVDGVAPDSLKALAGPDTPWPGRERPLCPYPSSAVSRDGVTFACKGPDGRRRP